MNQRTMGTIEVQEEVSAMRNLPVVNITTLTAVTGEGITRTHLIECSACGPVGVWECDANALHVGRAHLSECHDLGGVPV